MIKLVYEYICDECGEQHDEPHEMAIGFSPPHPHQPYGWTSIGGKLFCSKEKVTIRVGKFDHLDEQAIETEMVKAIKAKMDQGMPGTVTPEEISYMIERLTDNNDFREYTL